MRFDLVLGGEERIHGAPQDLLRDFMNLSRAEGEIKYPKGVLLLLRSADVGDLIFYDRREIKNGSTLVVRYTQYRPEPDE